MRDRGRTVLTAVVVLAAVAAIILAVVTFRGRDHHSAAEGSAPGSAASPTSSATGIAVPTLTRTTTSAETKSAGSTSDPAGTGPAPGQANSVQPGTLNPVTSAQVAKLAGNFVTAYQERSYEDPQSTTWLLRCKPLVTPEFYQRLSNDASRDSSWDGFVKDKTVITVKATPTQPMSQLGKVFVGVSFTQTVASDGQKPIDYPGFLTVYVTHDGGTWLVSALSTSPPEGSGN